MRELTPLEEGFLYADSRRTTFGHSGLFIRFDASATPWDELALDAVRDQVAERLADIPPLRWRLAPNPSAPRQHCLVDEGGVDLVHHVREARVLAGGGQRELARLVADLNAEAIDRAHPLWELHVMRGTPAGVLAILFKIHHATADGLATVNIMKRLFGSDRGDALPAAVQPERGIDQRGSDPPGPPESRPSVPWTRFNRWPSRERDFAFGSLEAEPLHAARRAAGVTFNEALLAGVAGGLRSWLSERGELPAERLVASLPASLRGPGRDTFAANRVTLLDVELPTDEPDPARRLAAARDALRTAKERARTAEPWTRRIAGPAASTTWRSPRPPGRTATWPCAAHHGAGFTAWACPAAWDFTSPV